MLTQYAASIPAPCAFPPEPLTNVLGEYLAKHGKTSCASPRPRSTPM